MSTRRTVLVTTDDLQSQLAHAPTAFPALLTYLASLFSLSPARLQLFDSRKAPIASDTALQRLLRDTHLTPTIHVHRSLIGLPDQQPPSVDYVVGFTDRSQLRLQQVADHSVKVLTAQELDWTGRAAVYPPDWVLLTGGEARPKSACLVAILDDGRKTVKLRDMNEARVWHGLWVAGGTAYVVGGKDPKTGSPLQSTEMLADEDWTRLGPLTRPRESLAVVGHRDVVYAVGGFDGTARLHTIEAMRKGVWTELPMRLPEPRQMPGVVFVTDGKMMVVGGQDGTRAKRSVYLVDVDARKVETMPQLPVPDYFTGRQLVKVESGEIWGFGKQMYIYFPSLHMWATTPSPTRRVPPS